MPETLKQVVDRVKTAAQNISEAIVAKGGTVTEGDGLEAFAADIATIPSGGGGASFVGKVTIASERFDLDLTTLLLEVNDPGYGNTSAASTVVFEYNGQWELCVAFIPVFVSNSDNCIIGTNANNCYYDNPSLELRKTNGVYTGCWFGFSSGNSFWNYGQSMTFDEPLVLDEEYILKMGIDADSHAYVTLTRVSTGAVIGNSLSTGAVTQANNYRRHLALGGNAKDGRFVGVASFDLARCYYKENGVILWGVDA